MSVVGSRAIVASRFSVTSFFARRLGTVALSALALLPVACGGDGVAGSVAAATETPVAVGAASTPETMPPAARSFGAGLGLGKYLAGRMAQEQFDSANAADYYLLALRADPRNLTLANRAYFYLLAEGRMQPALEIAGHVAKADPSSTVAPLVLAIGEANAEHYAAASERLSKVSNKGLNSFVVPLLRAWSLAGQKKWDEAQKALDPIAKQPQMMQLAAFHSGLIYDLAGRDKEAWDKYKATLAGSDSLSLRSVEVIGAYLTRHNRLAEAQELIARYRSQHPDSTLADALFGSSQAPRPSLARPVNDARQGMAEALYGVASSVVQGNALDTALVFARLAVMLRPDFPFAEMMVGDVLFNQQRFAEAAALFEKVPTDSPVYFPVRLRLADALDSLGKTAEAEHVLRQLGGEFPEALDPWVSLGDLMRRQEKWDPAVAAYQMAFTKVDSAKRNTKALWGLYYSLGIAQERGGHWAEAEQTLLQALAMDPDQPMVLNYLGYSWIDRGMKLDEGKKMIERAVELRPTDGYIIDSLGWAYYLTADYERAVSELERAIEYAPADPTINDHLGDALAKVGRRNEATFQWERALTLKPDAELEKKLKEKLGR